jgi:hypothetical protein
MYVFWELLFGQAIHQIPICEEAVAWTTHLSKDSIHTPYNQWLKAQKEWSVLYSRTVSQDAIPEVKEMMVALLRQGEQPFVRKSYRAFLL